jgi:hypothetical protein
LIAIKYRLWAHINALLTEGTFIFSEIYFRKTTFTAFNYLGFAGGNALVTACAIVSKLLIRFAPRRAGNIGFSATK